MVPMEHATRNNVLTWDFVRKWVGLLTPSLTLIAMIFGFIFNTGERITNWEHSLTDMRREFAQAQNLQDKRITQLEDSARINAPIVQQMGRDISALRQGQEDGNKIQGLILRALVAQKK